MSWDQVAAGVELPFADGLEVPDLHPYPLDVPEPPAVDDIERAAIDAVDRFRDDVTPGMTIAVGAGSRGLTGRVELVRGAVAALRGLGAEPFVVPAMGSHGGATGAGQLHLLSELGITETSERSRWRSTTGTYQASAPVPSTPSRIPKINVLNNSSPASVAASGDYGLPV